MLQRAERRSHEKYRRRAMNPSGRYPIVGESAPESSALWVPERRGSSNFRACTRQNPAEGGQAGVSSTRCCD